MKLIMRRASVRWKGGSKGNAHAMIAGDGVLKRVQTACPTDL